MAFTAVMVAQAAFAAGGAPMEQVPGPGAAPHAGDAALANIVPPPPVPPAVMTRDESGKVTVRAIKLTEPLRVDGKLDEAIYRSVPPITDFIQQVPKEGAPATERTEVWVMFDDKNLYLGAFCYDSASPQEWVANEMRRDAISTQENFGAVFDTFFDRRNGFLFYTTPLAARQDVAFTDEGNPNVDWNPVWEVRTGRFDGGWTVEMAIPFKTLRYKSGDAQVWGIQMRRAILHKNEWTHLTRVPASLPRASGIQRISLGATLVGLDLPPASKNLEIKPYAISRLTADRLLTPELSNDLNGDVGVDVKYGVTANLTADLTVNTDFAQVEVDQQQVNLTRFPLFFPEKRDFFLEGRGMFEFGRTAIAGSLPVSAETPYLFYSRRIGLNQTSGGNRVVPIDVGGRLTGKVGKLGVGVMSIQAGDEPVGATPSTNFTVMRVKRDVLRRSSIGAMFTNRSDSLVTSGSNQAFGLDAHFSFFESVSMGGYYAQTDTPQLSDDDKSYQARFDYSADRYGLHVEQLHVGDNFLPEVGFLRRDNFNLTSATARFSPRPKSIKAVRKFSAEARLDYLENGAGRLETRRQTGEFAVEFENSDELSILGARNYELLVRPFVVSGVTILPGGYPFADFTTSYTLGPRRPLKGTISLQRGNYYDGTITALGLASARFSLTPQLSVEPAISLNRVERPVGSFSSRVLRARTDFAFSPLMFASALVQYSSSDKSFGSNLRFRWEYRPGSELFVVYTDERDTLGTSFPTLKNRAFVVKINRLLQF